MKLNILKSILATFLFSLLLVSCVDSTSYSDPNEALETYEFKANKTVQDLKNVYTTSQVKEYLEDDIIEAFVTSSDETGNFFNTITFQSQLATIEDNPIGFSVSLELKGFNKGFKPGRKVFIKLKGLYIAKVDGALKIGSTFTENGTLSIGRISQFDWEKHLFPTAVIVNEDLLVKKHTVTSDIALNDIVLNTLVEFDNVQFADGSLARTLYDVDSGGFATNHNMVSANGGITRYVRVSSFSLLSGVKVPVGRGKIRGVFSRFGSDYQLIMRYESDMKLTNPRTYDFKSSFTEDFNINEAATGNYNDETSYYAFKNYLNFNINATTRKNWFIKDKTVLEMSAFGGDIERNKCYFFVPVDMTGANTFTFQYKYDFYSNTGTAFKIYRTSNFIPGMKITDATLVDITTSFNLATASTPNFGSSGIYNIPNTLTGNGYFVFEYTGTNITTGPPVTTTVRIDNIVVN